jgi:ubiquinone/menaquinone biosynthesis C-methylase UbiE
MNHFRAIAEYYDAENEHHAMLRHDVPFFLGQLPRRKRLNILEVACGTGRAAIPIAQAGHRVVGIDHAPDMLAIARRKRDMVGLNDRNLKLVHQNALALRLPGERFDWACIFFNTFLGFVTLDEQDRLLRGIHKHLRPRGKLWLDVFFPNIELLARPHSKGLEPNMFYVHALERTVYRETEIRPGRATQTQRVTFHYRWFDTAGDAHREKREFGLTWLFAREMQMLLERNGFRLDTIYGNYDGNKLTDDSPRMITVATRV